MSVAHAFNTDRIWILNVGDLKNHELPTDHFLTMAYDFERWPRNSMKEYLTLWAERDFGSEHAAEIADIMTLYGVSLFYYSAVGNVRLIGHLSRSSTLVGATRSKSVPRHFPSLTMMSESFTFGTQLVVRADKLQSRESRQRLGSARAAGTSFI
jgi:hypothetical protein